jgi:hypothetical protein
MCGSLIHVGTSEFCLLLMSVVQNLHYNSSLLLLMSVAGQAFVFSYLLDTKRR